MADIELVIKIPEEAKIAFDRAESNDLKGSYYDFGGVIGKAIKNGTPLPEHHGKIGDIDKLKAVFNKNVVGAKAFDDLFDAAEAIIPATKEGD